MGDGPDGAFERLSRTLEALAAERSVEEVLEHVAREAAAALETDAATVILQDEAQEGLRLAVVLGLEAPPSAFVRVPVGQGPCGLAFETRRPRIITDIAGAPLIEAWREHLVRVGIRSLVSVPILAPNGRPFGAMTLHLRREAPPGDADVARAETYARLAALAIDRDRLFEAARSAAVDAGEATAALSRTRRLASLHAVTASLAEALTVEEVARVVAVQGYEAVAEASASLVVLLEPEGDALRIVASRGGKAEAFARWSRFPLAAPTPAGEAMRTDRPVWIRSYEAIAAAYPELAADVGPENMRALAVLPLHADNRAAGALAFAFRVPKTFEPDKRDFLLTLARLCGQALDRARLYEEERRLRLQAEESRRRLQALADAGVLLSRSLDWEDTIVGAARLALGVLADWCLVDVVEPDEEGEPGRDDEPVYRRVASLHRDPERVEDARALMRFPPHAASPSAILDALTTGRVQVYLDVPDAWLSERVAEDPHARAVRSLGLRSFISAPLVARGRTLGAISFARSFDARPFVEADVPFAEELARRVALALDNARLYRDATRAVKARDEFLSIAGHELRTPLTALQLQVQGLRRSEGTLDARALGRVAKVAHNVERLAGLVDEILEISSIAAGHLEVVPAKVDLARLVEEVVARAEESLGRSGCEVRLDAPEPVLGYWDRMRIEQVFASLLANARKYGHGAPIDVSVFAADGAGVLRVRDRGIGIAADDQVRIFRRFERAVSSRNFGGFGVGLWIARQVVEAHGGRIEVESAPDEGATFTVRLPLIGEGPAA